LDQESIAYLRATGVNKPYEKDFIRKDGTRIPIIAGAAMLDEARHQGVAFVLDITERKQAEAEVEGQRQLLETVVMRLPAGVGLYRGTDLRIELVNPVYQAISPGKPMIGERYPEVWPEAYSAVRPLLPPNGCRAVFRSV